jgi:hypothetical protein
LAILVHSYKDSAPPILELESEKKADIKKKTETHAKVIVSEKISKLLKNYL